MDINQLNERLALCRASVCAQDSQYFKFGGCIAVRDVDGELRVGYGTMALAEQNADTEYGLNAALYYETYEQGKLDRVVYKRIRFVLQLKEGGLNLLPNTEFTNELASKPKINPLFKGEPTWEIVQRERLWWEIERDEKRAAFERMVALRNAVRRICGQGGGIDE